MIFRSSDHNLTSCVEVRHSAHRPHQPAAPCWTHPCRRLPQSRGPSYKQADSAPSGHTSAAPPEGFAPAHGCVCKGEWGYQGTWFANGGCQDPSEDEQTPWCFTEGECGYGGGASWMFCEDAAGRSASVSLRRRRLQAVDAAAAVPITKFVELTMVNDPSQYHFHEQSADTDLGALSALDQDAVRGGRTRVGTGGETRSAMELVQERSLQLANAAANVYRTMGMGIGITLVAVRTFEDTASATNEGLEMDAVSESIGDYLGKLTAWRGGTQPTVFNGFDLSSDNTVLITARDMLMTAHDTSTSSVAGLAGMGTMCSQRSSNVCEDKAGGTWQWAAETVSHE